MFQSVGQLKMQAEFGKMRKTLLNVHSLSLHLQVSLPGCFWKV